jgi:hypothetical protein
MSALSETHLLPDTTSPTDVISLDAAYAIVSEMRGVYKNALEASSAKNRGLQAAAQVTLFAFNLEGHLFNSKVFVARSFFDIFSQQSLETSNQQLRAALAQCATLCAQGTFSITVRLLSRVFTCLCFVLHGFRIVV